VAKGLFSSRNWEAVSGVLLLLCSMNLEEIETKGGPSSAIYVRVLLRQAARSQRKGLGPAFFTKQRRFSLKLHNTERGPPPLSCALEIKSILELCISSLVDNNLSQHHLTHFIPLWHLEYTATSLSMLRCQLDSELLRTFLYRFHSLRSFEYLH
jgi:hypothetical protein